jgi:hypothetical protein
MPRTAEYVFTTEPGVSKPNTRGALRDSTCQDEKEEKQNTRGAGNETLLAGQEKSTAKAAFGHNRKLGHTPVVTNTEQLIEKSS